MTQFMENRLHWLIGLIAILMCINITEIVFATAEERDITYSFDEGDMAYIIEKQELNRRMAKGEFGSGTQSALRYMHLHLALLDKYDPSEKAIEFAKFEGTGGFNPLDIFTIEIPNTPYYIGLILSIFNIALVTISGVIIASYIYDGIKALPFT